MMGGSAFSRGHLYRILANPLYSGEIEHKGQRHAGQHPAVIDRETWEAVQALLKSNSHAKLVKAHSKNPSLLAGLLVDGEGEKLVATHANKQGRRYRYYVGASTLKHRADCDTAARAAAQHPRGSRPELALQPSAV